MMEEKERIETFLSAFKELESYFEKIENVGNSYISFSKMLNDIYYGRKNPVVANIDNYNFLKSSIEIRNILSHENDICSPTDKFLEKFLLLKEKIVHPLTVYAISSKNIKSLRMDSSLKEAIDLMDALSLSHLPILDDKGLVIAIFSRMSLFDYIKDKGEINLDSLKMEDFIPYIYLDRHSNERFLFVKRNDSVEKLFPMLFKNKEHEKNIGLLLVTENGKENEKLLGVITLTDIAKYSL